MFKWVFVIVCPFSCQDPAVFLVDAAGPNLAQRALEGLPWPVHHFLSVTDLLEALPGSASGCVVVNTDAPATESLQLLEMLNSGGRRLALILLCGRIEVPEAVAAMRAGVHDILQVPVAARALRQRVEVAVFSQISTQE